VYGCAPQQTPAYALRATAASCWFYTSLLLLHPPPPAGSWLPSHGPPPALLVPGGGLLPGAARASGARCYCWYGQSFSSHENYTYILSFQFSLSRTLLVFQVWMVRHRAAGIAGSPTSPGSMAHIMRYRYLLPPTLTNFGRRVFVSCLISLRAHE
jgi:hypothetical protein